MIKVVATMFDAPAWEQHGLSWMRAVKSAGYNGLVVDAGLPAAAKSTLREVKFSVLPLDPSKTGPYRIVANNLKENERCFWCADYNLGKAEAMFAGVGLVATCDDSLPLANMVMSVANLQKRADAANLIETKVLPIHGSPLDTKHLGGGVEDWSGFVGYYEFLVDSSFLEMRSAVDRIALNLYASYFPGRLTTV